MSKTRVVIKVTSTVASCDCGETSTGADFEPEKWARLIHQNRHSFIYVQATVDAEAPGVDPRNPRVEDFVLEGAYGDSVEGWKLEKDGEDMPVLIHANGERLKTLLVAEDWRGSKFTLSLRVPRPSAPEVEIMVA